MATDFFKTNMHVKQIIFIFISLFSILFHFLFHSPFTVKHWFSRLWLEYFLLFWTISCFNFWTRNFLLGNNSFIYIWFSTRPSSKFRLSRLDWNKRSIFHFRKKINEQRWLLIDSRCVHSTQTERGVLFQWPYTHHVFFCLCLSSEMVNIEHSLLVIFCIQKRRMANGYLGIYILVAYVL